MRWPTLLLLLAACGDDGHATLADAATDSATMVDALPAGCDYAEQRDTTNDDVSPATGTAEDTGITLASRAVICGAFEHTHFDGDITVDIDGYKLSLAADADVLVRIAVTGGAAIELVGIDVYSGAAFDQRVGGVTLYGDHGVAAIHLAAGTYELLPFALASQAIAATAPYRMQIESDTPGTRCAELATGGFAEASDGAASTGNDVVQFPSGAPIALTTAASDAPEASGHVLAAAARVRISGSAADVAVADRYEDRDTFAFATAPGTNEITVRLAWIGAADLDVHLFEATNVDPVVRSTATTAGSETFTFSIKPDSPYWLVVGAKAGGSGLPAAYSATVCGATFTP